MDKSTLSGYGWVIIVTLILAVMLAFATPFGKYVGQGVSSVAKGFVSSGKEALSEENRQQLDEEWDDFLNERTTGTCIIGDADKDGDVDAKDLAKLNTLLYKKDRNLDISACDINWDGKVNKSDRLWLQRYVDGWNDSALELVSTSKQREKKTVEYILCTVGDADNNDAVLISDLVLLQKLLNGAHSDSVLTAYDINWDGVINVVDEQLLQRYINGEQAEALALIGSSKDWVSKQLQRNTIVVGDIDSDGIIDAGDVVILGQLLAGWNISTTEAACDINWDGKITSKDYKLLSQYLAEWNNPTAIGEVHTATDKTIVYADCIVGDITGDEIIDADDLNSLRNLVEKGLNETSSFAAADINLDGTVNMTDLDLLQRYTDGETSSALQYIGMSQAVSAKNIVSEQIKVGDINMDAKVDLKDLGCIVKIRSPQKVNLLASAADINRDGKVDDKDEMLLQKYLSNESGADLNYINTYQENKNPTVIKYE